MVRDLPGGIFFDTNKMMADNFPKNELPEKLPPQNIEAEQSLLGCLMLDKNAVVKVADFLKSEDFYKNTH